MYQVFCHFVWSLKRLFRLDCKKPNPLICYTILVISKRILLNYIPLIGYEIPAKFIIIGIPFPNCMLLVRTIQYIWLIVRCATGVGNDIFGNLGEIVEKKKVVI